MNTTPAIIASLLIILIGFDVIRDFLNRQQKQDARFIFVLVLVAVLFVTGTLYHFAK